ncbi:MAG TPA: glycoside hydrolase family 127 protein [Anaerohalosphaeraceae bacterium]|nr:glycoside hydrolase family 127 protein [Anaerohalosphaeraceae bacterium]HQG06085.1 glycoside hydrolase family 127 protein [Anaerohalosphaeraceae bacterium]HQI07500.1 glycoside hydrolase family 127 protein [Anaerohalosphaeraceae bacterium]HQJ67794.1 glycoside hydrolase family 127 protein [Anaerohalosphaeraceae bacterium]
MKQHARLGQALRFFAIGLMTLAAAELQGAADYPYQPVPFTKVQFTDGFWQPRIETNLTVTIPYAFEQCEKTHRIDNFKIAGKLMEGRWEGEFGFNDSDVYKIIEGASYGLMVRPDPKMDAYLDELIGYIAAAQEPDGYLYTALTANAREGGKRKITCCYNKERWDNLPSSHELYNAGHMYEGAAAHYLATGKRSFLEVAIKNADLICQVFGPGRNEGVPGHQEIEIGLVKLYRVTGDEKYLRQAKWFLDQRGRSGHKDAYMQSHKPVTEQTEAVGHAVRAAYMYSAMADVAALTGDAAYIRAVNALWNNVAHKKLYVTGGIGARHQGEAFGDDYELPNATAYCETCANIANVYWNHRMFLLHGEARYIDVMERSLYNSVISGVSLDGKRFFYPNPLESEGNYERSEWFGCACCPGNITRFLASVSGYAYAVRGNEAYVNLFGQSQAELSVDGQKVKIVQETKFPWEGRIVLKIQPEKEETSMVLNVRIPDWATDDFRSSELYHFTEPLERSAAVAVNGQPTTLQTVKGYAVISRTWKAGDTVTVELPMPNRRILCDRRVQDNIGKTAFQRGPLVYCLEWPDVEGGKVLNLMIEPDAPLEAAYRVGLLGGVTVLRGTGMEIVRSGEQISKTPRAFEAIPYYAWAHRGPGQMAVWIAGTEAAVRKN